MPLLLTIVLYTFFLFPPCLLLYNVITGDLSVIESEIKNIVKQPKLLVKL